MENLGHDVIVNVMKACSVSEAQAVHLLKYSNNDSERAQHRHQTLLRFTKLRAKSPLLPPVNLTAPGVGDFPSKDIPLVETKSVEPSEESSEGEGFAPTPRPEKEKFQRSPTSLREQPAEPHKPSPEHKHEPTQSRDLASLVPPDSSQQHRPGSGEGAALSSDAWMGGSMEFTTVGSPSTSSPRQDLVIDTASPEPPNTETGLSQIHGKEQNGASKSFDESDFEFLLPWLLRPPSLIPGQIGNASGFNAYDISAAIQHGADVHAVRTYFQQFDLNVISRHINENVAGYPSIFYAVATNDDHILRIWTRYGADVNSVHPATGAPLLAFAILNSDTIKRDTSHMVATLLSLNASALAIPSPVYTPYFRNLPDDILSDEVLQSLGHRTVRWLTKDIRTRLARTTHLTHRYNLERASKIPRPSARHWQIARRKNAEALLGLPYFLIGQSMASNYLLHKLLSHLAVPSRKPLVLVFAGPSGHGKTELARQLGHLLGLELEVVDCTIVSREMELFGGRHPYVNADQGTPLNNFLARNHGQRSIVFLDEFEKTTKEIHQALLLPFDNGEYQDRRNLQKVDCSQTIWVIATNALDKKIKEFCQVHGKELFDDKDLKKKANLLNDLSKELKEDLLSKFAAPVTGRVSAFLPFLLFSPGEQAVIAHKYLLELGRDVRRPVNLVAGADERLVGNVRLRVRRDASVCKNISDDGYHPELGARSLINAVDAVKTLLVDTYLEVDTAIKESETLVDFIVDVNGAETVVSMA